MKRVYIIWLLSICILPFLQGGYFYHEALFFGLVQGLVLLFVIFNGKVSVKFTGFRWMYCLIIAGGLISSFTAIDKGMHFVGFLKLTVPLLFVVNLDSFYKLYSQKLIADLKLLYILVSTSMVSIMIVVLTFFDSDFFLFKYFVQGPRIGGFFQYANTFGMFLYACLMLAYVTDMAKQIKIPVTIILIIGLMLSQSRGILLILLATFLLLIVFNVKRQRLVYLISISGIGLGQGLLWWLKDQVEVFRGLAILENQSEWLIRLLYYEDSLPMIFRRLTGYGHLGYYYSHQYYQTGASYKVKYLHNSLLQFTIDYGLIAGIALLLIGIYACVLVYRAFREDKFINVRDDGMILVIAALGLFAHSLIDFDFQFMGFVIVYFTVLFFMEHKYSQNVKEVETVSELLNIKMLKKLSKKDKGTNRLRLALSIGLIICLIVSFGYIGSVSLLDYEQESLKAYKMYPYYTDSVDKLLKSSSLSQPISDEEKLALSIETIDRNKYYINGFAFLRDYYYNSGDLETAIKYSKNVYLLAPLRLDYYEAFTKITVEHVLNLYRNNLLMKDDQYLRDLLDIYQYMINLENDRKNTYNVKHKVNFKLTEDMIKIYEKSIEIYNTIQE